MYMGEPLREDYFESCAPYFAKKFSLSEDAFLRVGRVNAFPVMLAFIQDAKDFQAYRNFRHVKVRAFGEYAVNLPKRLWKAWDVVEGVARKACVEAVIGELQPGRVSLYEADILPDYALARSRYLGFIEVDGGDFGMRESLGKNTRRDSAPASDF
jgi:hypothetical protein